MTGRQVSVTGLNQLRKALKQAGDREFLNELKKANMEVAGKALEYARPEIATASTTVAQESAVVRSERGGRVRFTNVRAGGTIFGAHHDMQRVGPSGRQFVGFNQFRLPLSDGYDFFVAPAVDDHLDELAELYETAIDEYLDKRGVPR